MGHWGEKTYLYMRHNSTYSPSCGKTIGMLPLPVVTTTRPIIFVPGTRKPTIF